MRLIELTGNPMPAPRTALMGAVWVINLTIAERVIRRRVRGRLGTVHGAVPV